RVLEHFGGHVLSLVTAAHTTGDERVHALEIPLVQLAESARVLLRGLDERALVVCSGHPLYKRSEKAKSHAQACEPASENDAADLGGSRGSNGKSLIPVVVRSFDNIAAPSLYIRVSEGSNAPACSSMCLDFAYLLQLFSRDGSWRCLNW